MGGCCCSSRKAPLQGTPVYYYCPPSLENQQSLRSYNGTVSALPAVLVGLNLDTTSPDTFRPPPAPLPFNVLFGRPQTPHSLGSQGLKCDAATKSIESAPVRDTATANSCDTLVPGGNVDKPEGKTLADILLASPAKSDELSKLSEPNQLAIEEEDACPICLEEYDTENPKMVTSCEHDFHLSCLLEWMERSDSCPVCDKEMIFDHPDDQL